MSTKLYKVGKYIRLSQESKNYHRNGEDSASIENQDAMLSKFIGMMPGWIETRTYIDDGASGANFNRKGFMDMMEDVRAGVITLVLVKDLSRFGRNYLEAGRYLEEELPMLGCRFVALSDGIDTETGENDILPFLNAINDFYVRDASERIKKVITAKAKEGHKITGAPPYGYNRHKSERHRLIIDEYASTVVQKAFDLRATGLGYAKVAGELNKDGVLPPRLYYFTRQCRETKAATTETWTIRTIKLMLNNEVYLGHTVSLKRAVRSYRDSTTVMRNESDWIMVENTHPAIISSEVWDKVQALNHAAKETALKQGEPTSRLFAGLVICHDCGAKMGYSKTTSKLASGITAEYGGYVCRTFSRSGRVTCSSHYISESALKALVLKHIKEMAAQITLNESSMVERLMERLLGSNRADNRTISKEIRRLEQRLYELDNQVEEIYEAKIEGQITPKDFSEAVNQLEDERSVSESRLRLLNTASSEARDKLADIEKWAALCKEKSAFDEVDRELLETLIDKIEVGQKQQVNAEFTQDVRIFYKYVGLC